VLPTVRKVGGESLGALGILEKGGGFRVGRGAPMGPPLVRALCSER